MHFIELSTSVAVVPVGTAHLLAVMIFFLFLCSLLVRFNLRTIHSLNEDGIYNFVKLCLVMTLSGDVQVSVSCSARQQRPVSRAAAARRGCHSLFSLLPATLWPLFCEFESVVVLCSCRGWSTCSVTSSRPRRAGRSARRSLLVPVQLAASAWSVATTWRSWPTS